MEAPPPATGVSPGTVERAVNALQAWRATKLKTQKAQLLEQDEFMYVVISLKKIPEKGVGRVKPYKVSLPHRLANPEDGSSELCLIIDDRHKSGLTKESAKKKIEHDGIPISKIIKLSKLKTDYRPFEAKRKLCDSYDLFFADRRVLPLLPKMLGKEFFRKKKIPVAIDLKHKGWKEQIENACGSALVFVKTGTCSVVKAAKLSMEKDEIVENVMATINGVVEKIVPKKWGGVRSIHMKLLDSLALPVYEAVPELKLKIEGQKDEIEEETEKEVETENVEEGKTGKKKKGRISEIRYMDSNGHTEADGEELSDGDDEAEAGGSADVVVKKRKKEGKTGKKKKGRISEIRYMDSNGDTEADGEELSDGDDEAEAGGSAEVVVKKRKKGIKAEGERRAKKVSKVKNVEVSKVKNVDGVKRKKDVSKGTNETAIKLKKKKKV